MKYDWLLCVIRISLYAAGDLIRFQNRVHGVVALYLICYINVLFENISVKHGLFI